MRSEAAGVSQATLAVPGSVSPASAPAAVPSWMFSAAASVTSPAADSRHPHVRPARLQMPRTQETPVPTAITTRSSETGGRHSTRNPLIIGTGGAVPDSVDVSTFRAIPRRQWIYVGRVAPGTTPNDVLKYVNDVLHIQDAKCEQLTDNDDICSFKLGVREDVLHSLLVPEKWPPHMAVKEFIPRRRLNVGNFRQHQ